MRKDTYLLHKNTEPPFHLQKRDKKFQKCNNNRKRLVYTTMLSLFLHIFATEIANISMEKPQIIYGTNKRNGIEHGMYYWNILPENGYISLKYSNDIREMFTDERLTSHCHNFYVMCLPLSEKLGYETIDHFYEISPETLIIEHPYQIHQYSKSAYPNDTLIISFTDEFLSMLGKQNYMFFKYELLWSYDAIAIKNKDILNKLIFLFRKMVQVQNDKSDEFIYNMKQEASMMEFFALLTEQTKENNAQDNALTRANKQLHNKFIDFLILLDKHYGEEEGHFIKFYSEQLNMSTKDLAKCIIDNSGKTFKQLIQDKVESASKRLLLNSELRISEIAELLGFKTASYFCTWFKKVAHIAPKDFKGSIHINKMYAKNGVNFLHTSCW